MLDLAFLSPHAIPQLLASRPNSRPPSGSMPHPPPSSQSRGVVERGWRRRSIPDGRRAPPADSSRQLPLRPCDSAARRLARRLYSTRSPCLLAISCPRPLRHPNPRRRLLDRAAYRSCPIRARLLAIRSPTPRPSEPRRSPSLARRRSPRSVPSRRLLPASSGLPPPPIRSPLPHHARNSQTNF